MNDLIASGTLPTFAHTQELVEEARKLHSIYLHRKNSSINTLGATLSLFIQSYAEDDKTRFTTTNINIFSPEFKNLKKYDVAVKDFVKRTTNFWDNEHIKDATKMLREKAEKAKGAQQKDDDDDDDDDSGEDQSKTPTSNATLEQLLQRLVEHAIKEPSAASSTDKVRTDFIGLFQPDLETFGEDTITQGDKLIFRDVNLFVDNAIRAGATHGNNLVASRLHLCLRGTASTWYATLDNLTKNCLSENLHSWRDLLIKHFQISLIEAGERFEVQRYTIQDMRDNRPPYDYVLAIERYGRIQGLPSYVSASKAWRGIDAVLRRDIPEPTNTSAPTELAEQMRIKLPLWREIYSTTRYAPRGYTAPSLSYAWQTDPATSSGYNPPKQSPRTQNNRGGYNQNNQGGYNQNNQGGWSDNRSGSSQKQPATGPDSRRF